MRKFFVCNLLAAGLLLTAQTQADITGPQQWTDAPDTGFELSYDQTYHKRRHYNPVFNYPGELTEAIPRNGNDIFPLLGSLTDWDGEYEFPSHKKALKIEFLRMAFHEFLLVEFLDFLKDYDFGDKFGGKHCWPKDPTPEVPVPAAAWLFGSALLSLASVKRLKSGK